MSESDLDHRLLTEHSRAGDVLQHRPLARALAQAIQDTPSTESLGIALYGAWGQGKSMIGSLVRDCLEDDESEDRNVFIRIDAWKYAHEGERQPLRRHYLLNAYEAAGLKKEAEALRRAFSQKVISHGIDERSGLIEFLSHFWRRCVPLWPFTLILILVIATLWLLLPNVIPALVLSSLGLIAAVLFSVSVMVDTVVKILATGLTVTTEEDPFRSVEEFDHQFSRLLDQDAADVDRFVFFIDDLDRCQDNLVVEAIETLQAFFGRQRCAYIVAADERQLKRAVRARSAGPVELVAPRSVIPIDETFLEKIFQVSIQVPPLYEENLVDYARVVSRDTEISRFPDDLREDLLGYLVHAEVISPRQVRVIINDYLIALFESREREAQPDVYLGGSRLTTEPLLLAKMVVLRSHFPWFFRLLYARPEILVWWPETFGLEAEETAEHHTEADLAVRTAASHAVREAKAFSAPVQRGLDNEQEQLANEMQAETLVRGLRGYLTLTSETVPEDPARVEEFLYLRGRAGFAGLSGDVGRSVRRALQTGDVSQLDEAFQDGPDNAKAAADAALDRMQNGTRLERLSARRALLGLVGYLSGDALRTLGQQVTTALYPSGMAMGDDDVQARQSLIPWFDRTQLATHIDDGWPKNAEDIVAVLRRGVEIDAESVVAARVGALLDEPVFIEAVCVDLENAEKTTVESYLLPVAQLGAMFGEATDERSSVRLTLQPVSGRRITGPNSEDGTMELFALARDLGFEPEEFIGQEVVVDVVQHRRLWKVVRLALADGSRAWEGSRPDVIGEQARSALRTLVATVFGATPKVTPEAVEAVVTVNYASANEATDALQMIWDAAERGALSDEGRSLRATLDGATLADRGELVDVVLDHAREFGDEAVRANGEALIRYLVTNTEYLEDESVEVARAALERLRDALSGLELDQAAKDAWETDFLPRYQLRALRLLVSVAPTAAIELTGGLLARLLAEELTEERIAEGEDALMLMEGLARTDPQKVGAVLSELQITSDVPALCVGLLRAAATAGMDDPPGAAVIRAGALHSRTGAFAALDALAGWKEVGETEIAAVLEGVATHAGSIDDQALATAVKTHRDVMTPVDQLGVLAAAGARKLAEKAAKHVRIRGGLVRQLFAAAKRVADLELVERRLRYVESWSQTSPKHDREAIVGYIAELERISTEDRFRTVMSSLLRFFPPGRNVPSRPDLREAVFDAMNRLKPIEDETLQALLETARTQLALETPSTRGRVGRIFERVFRQD